MREMKDSGIEWIGKIPESYSVIRMRYLINDYKAGPFGSALITDRLSSFGDILCYTPEHIAKQSTENDNNLFLPESRSEEMAQFFVKPGDVIFPIVGSLGRAMVVTADMPRGIINQRLAKFSVNTEKIDIEYFMWLFGKSFFFQPYIDLFQRGSIIVNLTKGIVYDMPFVLPPTLQEQKEVAELINKKCRQVDALIANVQAQIEKLKAYKQSIITEAVTKGLDPSAPMKDSGVKWIGEIPKTWNTIRVKQLLVERKERSVDGSEEPLSMSQKLGLVPTRMLDMIPNMASSFVGAKLTYVDDLVFNKLKAHLGVFSVSQYDGLVSPDYAVYYSTGKVHLKYLEYLFKTPQCISEFRKRSTGIAAGLTRLYTDGLFAIECPFPTMEEQIVIVDHLNGKCSQIDQLIAIKQKKIDKLNEYKKSLIYEYVTGKKEVS